MLFLFVDDDDNVAKAFAELAESLGHRAETASSGGDALRMAGQTRYDTVFMDIGLPDIDGRTLCEFLRSAGASVEACIVAVTGQRDLEDNLLEPFDGFLAKPATESELKRIIHRC